MTDPDQYTMSFGDHLEELRRRLLISLAAPLPLFIVLFFFSDTLIRWLLLPVYAVLRQHDLPADLQVLSPPEFLMAKLKVSLIAALVLSAPWLLWQLWLFVAPGLYQHERRFVYFLLPGSAILTVSGILLFYYVMLPLMLHVLVMFAADVEFLDPDTAALRRDIAPYLEQVDQVPILMRHPEELTEGALYILAHPEMKLHVVLPDEDGTLVPVLVPATAGRIAQAFRVSFVINFTLLLIVGIVIAFQMPLVIVLAGWLGLVSTDQLRAKRKWAMMICAVVSAMITPADAVSMLIMVVPLYGLYELGILLLLIAPARRVARGGLLRFGGSDKGNTDKRPEKASQPEEPIQSADAVPRSRRDDDQSDTEDL